MSFSDSRQDRREANLTSLRSIFERAGTLSDSAWEAIVPGLGFNGVDDGVARVFVTKVVEH